MPYTALEKTALNTVVHSKDIISMITRYAVFHGSVKPGKEVEMRDYVEQKLIPLWRQFDGAHNVKILYALEQDPNGPEIPLTLAITYPDQAAMEKALQSPARYESRDMLPAFYQEFFDEVTLYHYLAASHSFQPLSKI